MPCAFPAKKFEDSTGFWCIDTFVMRMSFLNIGLGRLMAVGAAALVWGGCSEKSSSEAGGASTEAKAYTLDTCVVSDEKLGSMGDPVVKVYDGQQVKFCCNSCVKDFEKDKAKFLAKITAAAAAPKK